MKYAVAVGGIAAIVALVITGWKLEAQTAIVGGLVVFVGMVLLVVFAALSRTGPKPLRPLALSLAWSFVALTVITASLFVSCAFADWPKPLPCLFGRCGNPLPTDKRDDTATVTPAMLKTADRALDGLYKASWETVYASFAPSVQQSLPFAVFREVARHQMAQLPGPPLRRKLRYDPKVEGVSLIVQYEAQFDSLSTWLETVVLVRVGNSWSLYRIDVQPLTWLSASAATSTILAEVTPSDALNGSHKTDLVGTWTPQQGWRATLKSFKKKAESTCDMQLVAGNVTLIGRDVLGGCKQKPGTALDLVGRVASSGKRLVELEQVRYQPADF